MGIDFGVIWVADFNIAIRFYVRRRQKDTCRHTINQKRWQMYRYVYQVWGYLGRWFHLFH